MEDIPDPLERPKKRARAGSSSGETREKRPSPWPDVVRAGIIEKGRGIVVDQISFPIPDFLFRRDEFPSRAVPLLEPAGPRPNAAASASALPVWVRLFRNVDSLQRCAIWQEEQNYAKLGTHVAPASITTNTQEATEFRERLAAEIRQDPVTFLTQRCQMNFEEARCTTALARLYSLRGIQVLYILKNAGSHALFQRLRKAALERGVSIAELARARVDLKVGRKQRYADEFIRLVTATERLMIAKNGCLPGQRRRSNASSSDPDASNLEAPSEAPPSVSQAGWPPALIPTSGFSIGGEGGTVPLHMLYHEGQMTVSSCAASVVSAASGAPMDQVGMVPTGLTTASNNGGGDGTTQPVFTSLLPSVAAASGEIHGVAHRGALGRFEMELAAAVSHISQALRESPERACLPQDDWADAAARAGGVIQEALLESSSRAELAATAMKRIVEGLELAAADVRNSAPQLSTAGGEPTPLSHAGGADAGEYPGDAASHGKKDTGGAT